MQYTSRHKLSTLQYTNQSQKKTIVPTYNRKEEETKIGIRNKIYLQIDHNVVTETQCIYM